MVACLRTFPPLPPCVAPEEEVCVVKPPEEEPDLPELQHRSCDIGRTIYEKSGELNIRISVLIQLKKLYNCTYDDFFAGLDPDENNP